MKYLFIGICCMLLASSCQKVHTTDGGTPTTQNFEPTKQYDIKIIANNQQVVVDNFQKQDSILSMTYNQKVALVVRTDDYNQSWGIYFNQSFTGTALDGLLFQTYSNDGTILYNYVETNLNNVALQSKSDTTINGNTYTNLKISRVFTFLQAFPAGKAAADQARTALLARTIDKATFTTYFSYNGQTSVPITATAPLVYVKP